MKKTLVLVAIILENTLLLSAQFNTWTQKATFGGSARRGAVAFSIGDKGYVGTGTDVSALTNDFWEYDPVLGTWSQKADFTGSGRSDAVGFSIGSKGYVGTGYDGIAPKYNKKDFWEYNPALNTWTQKSDFPGAERAGAVGFAIDNKGYIGTGYVNLSPYNKKDFWEYDPDSDTWTSIADFPAEARLRASCFTIGNKAYVGTGYAFAGNYDYNYSDFWEYDPTLNAWEQKADFGGGERERAVGFAIASKGYLGTGYDWHVDLHDDFWEYDPFANTWTQKTDFSGGVRGSAIAFAIGNKGYLGTGLGWNGALYYFNDFWEYDPEFDTGIPSINNNEYGLSVFPNPTDGEFLAYMELNDEENGEARLEVLNRLGQIVYSQNVQLLKGVLQNKIQLKDAAEGMYLVKVNVNDQFYTAQISYQQ